jgi:hypothetical protein
MKRNITVSVDGVKQFSSISIEEAKEKAKDFSPYYNIGNTFYNERNEILVECKKSELPLGFDLEDLIAFLNEIHSKFGNMPVLYYAAETGCFKRFSLCDIDIVKSYFTLAGNLAVSSMDIKNEKALSFFHT